MKLEFHESNSNSTRINRNSIRIGKHTKIDLDLVHYHELNNLRLFTTCRYVYRHPGFIKYRTRIYHLTGERLPVWARLDSGKWFEM
jgi:hypothetical protein